MRMAWDGVVVVLEGPAADVLMTFTTDTVPPAEDAELVCERSQVMSGFMEKDLTSIFSCAEQMGKRPSTCGGLPVAAEAF